QWKATSAVLHGIHYQSKFGRGRTIMSAERAQRRDFLKLTGTGLAGSALAGVATTGTSHPGAAGSGDGFNVRIFGAKGDGTTLDTPAINKAIEAAAAAGGGTVRFSAGSYLSYSIHLKSNVDLFLGPGATIIAADPPAQRGTG